MPLPHPAPWALPPDLPWPQFLRLLRRPEPPSGWLAAAADLPELQKRPLLLRWIAQHPKAPAHLRARLLPRLPRRSLAAVAADAGAHPQAKQQATEKLQHLWAGLTAGERRSLAPQAPRPLWPLVWRTPSPAVLEAFLRHPHLGLEGLLALVQPPLRPAQAEALAGSPWFGASPLAEQVLVILDRTLALPESGLALGHGAPWIKALEPAERIRIANRITTPALRRMVHPRRTQVD